MSQKLSVNNFKWVKDISKFDESFIKSQDKSEYVIYVRNLKQALNHELVFIILKSSSQKNCWLQKWKKTQTQLNKPVHLFLPILELNKIVCMSFGMIT